MGTFIPVTIGGQSHESEYAKELEELNIQLRNGSFRSLSLFCDSQRIDREEFKRYLNDIGFDFSTLKNASNNPILDTHVLSGVSIKWRNRVEIFLPSVLPSQLSDIIKSL